MRMGLLQNIQFYSYCFCLQTKVALNWAPGTLSLHKGVRPKRRLYTKNKTRGYWLTQRARMTIKRITTNTKPPRETNCHNSHFKKNTPVSSVASSLVVVTDWLESVSCVGEGDEEDGWAVTVGDGTMLLWFWFACNRSGKTGMITWRWSQWTLRVDSSTWKLKNRDDNNNKNSSTDSLSWSWVPDSTDKDSGSHKQKFPDSRFQITLHGTNRKEILLV